MPFLTYASGQTCRQTDALVAIYRTPQTPFTRQTGLTTGWTTGWIVYTNIQPVVKSVVQPVWQSVGCLFTRCSRLSYRLYNRFNNRLYRVNGVSGGHILTTRTTVIKPSMQILVVQSWMSAHVCLCLKTVMRHWATTDDFYVITFKNTDKRVHSATATAPLPVIHVELHIIHPICISDRL